MIRISARRFTLLGLVLVAACSRSASPQRASSDSATTRTADAPSGIDKNETTLPTYPHLVKGDMFSVPNPQTGCIEYMSSTNDSLKDAIAWYRSKLGGARETAFQGDYQGIDFTVNGTDHVLVFTFGNTGTSITLQHGTTGKSCGRADGRAG